MNRKTVLLLVALLLLAIGASTAHALPSPPNYTVQEWKDKDAALPLSAKRLKHIEEGIAAVEAYAKSIGEFLETAEVGESRLTRSTQGKLVPLGGTEGQCVQRGSGTTLTFGACGSGGSGKSQAEIEVFALARAKNLEDLASAGTARTNLGLGTIATHAASEFATTTELALKAPLASPTFTGVPAGPTAIEATNTTQLATTAFAHSVASAAQTAAESAATTALALKAPLASPTLTGTPKAPTATAATNTEQLASTAFVQTAKGEAESAASTALALKAPLSSPTFTGVPAAPTATAATNTTQVASTAFVQTAKGEAEAASLAKAGTSVKTTNIEAGAVTEPKLGSEAVTPAKVKTEGVKAAGKCLGVNVGNAGFEYLGCGSTTLPEWLTGLESKSSSGGKIKLNLEKARAFALTITENTVIEPEKVPANEALEALVFFKENVTGGFTVTFSPAIKWVGTTPTFSTASEAESLATLVFRGESGKTTPTNVFGISGAEGKEGPKGTTGTTGPEGKVAPFIIPEKFAINGLVASAETYEGFFIPTKAAGEKWKLVGVQYATQKEGTDKFKVWHYTKAEGPPGKEVTWAGALKELKAETTVTKTAISGTLEPATEEYWYVESVTAATTPKGMAVDLEMEHEG